MKKTLLLIATMILAGSMTAELRAEQNLSYSETHKKSVSVKQKKDRQLIESGDISISRRQEGLKTRSKTDDLESSAKLKKRIVSAEINSQANSFEIYDSWISFELDEDNDGYYSQFSVNFDADYAPGHADVYADIFIRSEGEEWYLLHETDIFSIYSTESDDLYSVSIALNSDFPTGQYDILIDLYEAGVSGIVATAEHDNDSDLYGLFLEDQLHEISGENTDISFVASELFADLDFDGYYTKLTLEYDIETDIGGRIVYAEVELYDTQTQQLRVITTVDFQLGNQTEFIDLVFNSGYISSLYDVGIQLVDVSSGEVLASAGQDFSSLNLLPIESEEYDYVDHVIDVEVSGGGSFGLGYWLVGASLLLIRRRFVKPV